MSAHTKRMQAILVMGITLKLTIFECAKPICVKTRCCKYNTGFIFLFSVYVSSCELPRPSSCVLH